jgi:hypothetical protein
MKTVENLMIGDWVYRPDCYDKVVEIRKDTILGSDPLRGLIPITDLQPIPLTAEILEKNGFSELMLHDEWSRIFRAYHDDLFIEVGIYEPMFINIGYVDKEGKEQPLSDIVKVHGEIFYLHELQQALRLCGFDKEITL